MAEAAATIAAFGLASNAFQVIQFSVGFISKAVDIYSSGASASHEIAALQAAAANLRTIKSGLQARPGTAGPGPNAEDVDSKLAHDCAELLDELLGFLANLGDPNDKGRRKAIATAFKTMWNSEKLDQLEARVATLHRELTSSLVLSLR